MIIESRFSNQSVKFRGVLKRKLMEKSKSKNLLKAVGGMEIRLQIYICLVN
jgi:hypothetical protein